MRIPFTKSGVRRVVPGAVAIALAQEVVRHTEARLSKARRRRVLKLLRASHGRPSNLSKRQSRELSHALRDLEPWKLGAHLVKTAATARPVETKRSRS